MRKPLLTSRARHAYFTVMPQPIRAVPTPWTNVILLCGKCARKLDGGFGFKNEDSLRSALKTELKAQNRKREIQIIETRCLGFCPKDAVMALNARQPETVLKVPAGTGAGDVLKRLAETWTKD